MPIKVMTILGTRPEIIRLSRVVAALDAHVDHRLVHTGQNYDERLNGIFFRDLELREPDHYLNVDTSSLGATLGDVLRKSEQVLLRERPDALLVLGDTNSAISALMARRLKIPVFHMEAGNRSFDPNVPEETNRRVVDHVADFNLVYTEHARRHLLAEGLPHRRIYLTGSPMREVLDHYRPRIEASTAVEDLGLAPGRYFIVSAHREETVDSRERLLRLLETLRALGARHRMPVVISTHPRTRKRIDGLGPQAADPHVRYLDPFGFHDYNRLQMSAFCAISDSGTIAEESAILGFPAVTPREAIERPEALDSGSLLMTGLDPDTITAAVDVVTGQFAEHREAGRAWPLPEAYQVTNTSQRVVNLILGAAKLSDLWEGRRPREDG